MRRRGGPLVVVMVLAGHVHADGPRAPRVIAAAEVVAAGAPHWVETTPDDPLLDARVDLGTIRRVGDAYELTIRWPLAPGSLRGARYLHPELSIPDGSYEVSREQVICEPRRALSYAVESMISAPDGRVVFRKSTEPAIARAKAEEREASLDAMGGGFGGGYSANPRALVCWALARRCEGRPVTWPPPPDETPLEHSARAEAMRAAYDRQWVPSCRLEAASRARKHSR